MQRASAIKFMLSRFRPSPIKIRVSGMTLRTLLRHLALLLAVILSMAAGLVAACTPVRHILVTADPSAAGPAAHPDLFENLPSDPAERLQAWQEQRADLHAQLDAVLYGASPPSPARVELGPPALLLGSIESGQRSLATVDITMESGEALSLQLALVTPDNDAPLRGVLLVPTECGLPAALHDDAMPAPVHFTPGYCNSGDGGFLFELVGGLFGEWISGPPVHQALERGYGVVSWHESEIAPDSNALHAESLDRLGLDPNAADRAGTISLWAWTVSRVADALQQDARFADLPLVAYGHSRRGKAVLLAAARDDRITVTLSHQAGTGGSSLHGDRTGEPISMITESYPHWFVPAYAAYGDRESELPIDQHALIALVAPRAVLLGGAWRDTWSDPAGSFRAAQGASAAWEIYGETGLAQNRLADFDPSGRLAQHIRPGTHGVTDQDWDAFFAFMDTHIDAP